MFRISKRFRFDAAHQLTSLPPEHKCSRLHGHTYIVEVVLESDGLNHHGFVLDYGDLKALKDYIDTEFDHRYLNDVMTNSPPTAEMLAMHFFDLCKGLWSETVRVGVSETPDTWAWYER